jgi:hypothetical protein
LKYTPKTLDKMSLKQMAEAFEDILFVRSREKEATVIKL